MHKPGNPDSMVGSCRGKCDPAIPQNMGKLMRNHVVRHLRENAAQGSHLSAAAAADRSAPEINVCCHGQEAGQEVRSCYKKGPQAYEDP